jgi:hypothetical protein
VFKVRRKLPQRGVNFLAQPLYGNVLNSDLHCGGLFSVRDGKHRPEVEITSQNDTPAGVCLSHCFRLRDPDCEASGRAKYGVPGNNTLLKSGLAESDFPEIAESLRRQPRPLGFRSPQVQADGCTNGLSSRE